MTRVGSLDQGIAKNAVSGGTTRGRRFFRWPLDCLPSDLHREAEIDLLPSPDFRTESIRRLFLERGVILRQSPTVGHVTSPWRRRSHASGGTEHLQQLRAGKLELLSEGLGEGGVSQRHGRQETPELRYRVVGVDVQRLAERTESVSVPTLPLSCIPLVHQELSLIRKGLGGGGTLLIWRGVLAVPSASYH